MQVRLVQQQNVHFIAETPSGHKVSIDGPPDLGGENHGVRPMELLLTSLAGCAAMDVVMIMNKSRQPMENLQVVVDGTRADAIPAVFTDISLHFIVTGDNVDNNKLERAVTLSAEKFCSVSKMLEASVNITHSFEIIKP